MSNHLYICVYNGRQERIEAPNLYAAASKGRALFKLKPRQFGMMSTILVRTAEGQDVQVAPASLGA